MASLINSISPLSLDNSISTSSTNQSSTSDFFQILKDTIGEVNKEQKSADTALGGIATGQVKDLHQAAIAIHRLRLA